MGLANPVTWHGRLSLRVDKPGVLESSQPTTSCADLSSPSAGLEGDKMSIM